MFYLVSADVQRSAEPKQAGKRAQSQASLELCRTRAVRRRQTFKALNRREREGEGVWEMLSSLIENIEFSVLTSLTHLIALEPSVYRTLRIVRCLEKTSPRPHLQVRLK